VKQYLVKANAKPNGAWELGRYTILPLPICYGLYCNKVILRNSVGDEGGDSDAQTKGGVCEK